MPEEGVFELSRIRIRSPRSKKKVEGDPLYTVPRPERPVQVHHHHAEDVDVDVAVAERVDGSTIVKKKDIKTALPRRVVGQMIKHGTQTQTTGC